MPRLPATMQVFERGWLSSNNILFTGADNARVDSGYLTHAPQTLALVHHALGTRVTTYKQHIVRGQPATLEDLHRGG